MIFKIWSKQSGKYLGQYEGKDVDSALDAMAQDAGYFNYNELVDNVTGASKSELEIFQLSDES